MAQVATAAQRAAVQIAVQAQIASPTPARRVTRKPTSRGHPASRSRSRSQASPSPLVPLRRGRRGELGTPTVPSIFDSLEDDHQIYIPPSACSPAHSPPKSPADAPARSPAGSRTYAEAAAFGSPAAAKASAAPALEPHLERSSLIARISSMRVVDLRAALAAIGLSSQGLKAELAARLVEAVTVCGPLQVRFLEHLDSVRACAAQTAATPSRRSGTLATPAATRPTPQAAPMTVDTPSSRASSSEPTPPQQARLTRSARGAPHGVAHAPGVVAHAPGVAAQPEARAARSWAMLTPSVASTRLRSTRF